MLRIVRQSTGWSVLRDGVPVSAGTAGVTGHQLEDTAVRVAMRLAAATGEAVEPVEWIRHHADGWIARIVLSEDGEIWWQGVRVPGGGQLTRAPDIQDARDDADEAVKAAGHVCSAKCGRW